MSKYVYIDPQSYNNLSLYDYGVLSEFEENEVTFFGSIMWDCSLMRNVNSRMWFTYNKYNNSAVKGVSYVLSLLRIAHYIQKSNPKLVHIQWTRFMPIDLWFLSFLRKRNIKTVFTAHNILPHDSGKKYFNQFKNYYSAVDKIIVHSSKTKDEVINLFQLESSKVDVIPHGILSMAEDDVEVNDRITEIKNSFKLGGKIVFSSLGLQSKYKGVDDVINVWSQNKFFFEKHNCHLLIIGKNSGIDYSPLSECKSVNIIDDRISNLDFLSYIRLSDVVLLPYKMISQSGVLFSAIDNNIPVVVSDVGGLTEPLNYGKIGWNIGKPSNEHLKECLMYLAQNPEEIISVKNNDLAFSEVKRIYSWERISNMTKTLYKSIISK